MLIPLWLYILHIYIYALPPLVVHITYIYT